MEDYHRLKYTQIMRVPVGYFRRLVTRAWHLHRESVLSIPAVGLICSCCILPTVPCLNLATCALFPSSHIYRSEGMNYLLFWIVSNYYGIDTGFFFIPASSFSSSDNLQPEHDEVFKVAQRTTTGNAKIARHLQRVFC